MRPGPVRCLAIGSSDSGGGAGIQGDIKAATALDAYCATAVVGVTAQNTQGVRATHGIPPDVVAAQIEAVLADIGVDAVKVGTTWSGEVIDAVVELIGPLRVPIVVDPVLVTASGAPLGDALDAVRARLLPVASVATPNLREAQAIAGLPDEWSPSVLAEELAGLGARAVLITDALGERGGDWLFDGREHTSIAGVRHRTGCEHGAGCAHSTALAVLLAGGMPLPRAARRAREVVASAVRAGAAGIGRGVHPVDIRAGLRRLARSRA
ncbi:bifunctional hydroxymethylpyrimidine kinase/phosphomethylpyrimidine kinase [Actinokineospora sp. 24-640]